MGKKFVIEKIENIKFIISKTEVVEKIKPNSIKVSKEEYQKFLKDNNKYIKESYLITPADSLVVKDYYDNVVARVYFYMEEEFFINPELLKLGLERKSKIEDVIKVTGEEIIKVEGIKPSSL